MDPRLYQIATLASLLVYGMGWLEFDITAGRAALLLATVLATQAAGDRLEGRAANWKSALISGLSLCLLLRTNDAALALLAGVVTIASKFVIRFRGKHIFNPTNGGLVAMLLLSDRVWVSPGQWGSVALFALLMASVGRPRRQSRLAQRRDLRVHRLLLRADLRPLALSRRADDDSDAPPAERGAAAVHVLHDFRSEDHSRFAGGPCAVCRARGLRRVVRAVPPLQNQRAAVVAGAVVGGGPAHRPAAAGPSLCVARGARFRAPASGV